MEEVAAAINCLRVPYLFSLYVLHICLERCWLLTAMHSPSPCRRRLTLSDQMGNAATSSVDVTASG